MSSNQTDLEAKNKEESINKMVDQLHPGELDDKPDHKNELKTKVTNWWQQEKDKIAKGEMLKFLQENKDRFDKTLSSIHKNNF
ncbi:MAG: hypothetical protein ACI8O8_002221, partial [Oleiphilaceae bacterium]